jgi:hypothetical protein
LLPLSGNGAQLGTRQRTITPISVTNAPVPPISPSAVSNYAADGYSSWQWDPGGDEGEQLTGQWIDLPGTSDVNLVDIPINAANPAVFYRLSRP